MSDELSEDDIAHAYYREAVYYEPAQLREEQVMAAYAANPMGVLADALMRELFGRQE